MGIDGNNALKSKLALVTGSTSGVGEAIAIALSEKGARVIFNSSKSIEKGQELADTYPNSTYCQGDISNPDDVERIRDHVLSLGGSLDILINNAGITKVIPYYDLEAANLDVWREIFEVNVFGTWNLTTKLVPLLKQNGGSIINITSIAGMRPTGSSIPYAASKSALIHITKLLAKTLGPEIRVNAISPGLVDTPWTKDWEVLKQVVRDQAPLKRTATPIDVAEICLGLLSSNFVTGEVIIVDGGWNLV